MDEKLAEHPNAEILALVDAIEDALFALAERIKSYEWGNTIHLEGNIAIKIADGKSDVNIYYVEE